MGHTVTLIPGDHTGPAACAATRRVLEAAGVDIAWEERPLAEREIPAPTLESLSRTKVGLMAFHHGWHARDDQPPIVQLRQKFGMFANVRPLRTLHGVPTRHDDIDIVLVREVTEDIYAHLEHESIPGVFESLKVTTRAACERIATFAFEHARANGRKKVTLVHKANIMKRSDGMFLRVGREVAAKYPDIAVEDVIVDALCMKLVLTPAKFDVLVAGNLYGDIVADLCAGLIGGATNCPSVNVGPDVRVFACPHGDPPGTSEVNPLTLLMPAIEMLRHLGESAAADRIRAAVEATLQGGVRPISLGGDAGCDAFTAALCERI